MGVIYLFLTASCLFSVFIVSVSREEGGAEWYCTILGTRLSETVCVAVGLIGVKGGRGVFTVRHGEVPQKTSDRSGHARLWNSPSRNCTKTNEEQIREKDKLLRDFFKNVFCCFQ